MSVILSWYLSFIGARYEAHWNLKLIGTQVFYHLMTCIYAYHDLYQHNDNISHPVEILLLICQELFQFLLYLL